MSDDRYPEEHGIRQMLGSGPGTMLGSLHCRAFEGSTGLFPDGRPNVEVRFEFESDASAWEYASRIAASPWAGLYCLGSGLGPSLPVAEFIARGETGSVLRLMTATGGA